MGLNGFGGRLTPRPGRCVSQGIRLSLVSRCPPPAFAPEPSTQTLVAGIARKVRQNNRVLLGQFPEERELAASVSFIQVNSLGTSASANFLSISKR